MDCKFLFTYTSFCLLISLISCVRILVVLPTPLYSHNLVYRTIYKELSLRGHEIVAFTPDPIKDPKLTNIKEIDMSFLYKHPELGEEVLYPNFLHVIKLMLSFLHRVVY